MNNSLTPDDLEKLFDPQPASGAGQVSRLVLHLSGVPHMDSMGLGKIVSEYNRLKGKGIHLIAAGVTPHVKELFELTHMNTVIPLAATVEEALAG